ncbi:hypothetical protein EIP91_004690 [Steccherinum ochraceum]|uniref:Uncharacterized protein n=1 Tax=Steccherinum ochraceum TaxID=92696 RepID=A0A4R0RJN0_9APHY|nr:hypothetical protein EIP91_004690 [Steccherinum ochraceum]
MAQSGSRAHDPESTETTPLILRVEDVRYVDPEVDRLATLALSQLQVEVGLESVDSLEAPQDRAYHFVVLLRLKAALHMQIASRDADDLSSDLEVQRKMSIVDSSLAHHDKTLHDGSVQDVGEFLFTDFLLREGNSSVVRAIDMLHGAETPDQLVRNRILELAYLRLWKYGHQLSKKKSTAVDRITRPFWRFSTPRIMHLLDLALFLLYFVALIHYAVQPPLTPVEPVQALVPRLREAFIMLYAFSQLFKPWEVTIVPYILTSLAFLSCLPLVPRSQDGAYSVLLFTVSLHLLQLHLPRSPSPLLLIPFDMALPLATLVQHGIFKIFIPVITFFLPALLLALFLLSTSLSDLLQHFLTLATTTSPSPLEARTAFLTLLAFIFILLLCSLMMLILVYPQLSSRDPPPLRWDRYSTPIGLEARRALISTVANYTQPTYFPAPLNIFHFILVRTPRWISSLFGWKSRTSTTDLIQGALWLVFVTPLAFVLSGLYLWGYL